jgi:hypothetical protein
MSFGVMVAIFSRKVMYSANEPNWLWYELAEAGDTTFWTYSTDFTGELAEGKGEI